MDNQRLLEGICILAICGSLLFGLLIGMNISDAELLKENARLRGEIDKINSPRETLPRPSGPSLFED